MMTIVLAGTAWFAALHPRFIWGIVQREAVGSDNLRAGYRMIRLTGLGLGAVGVMLLFLLDG